MNSQLQAFLIQNQHRSHDKLFYLYSDINSSNIKQEIINHLNSEGFIKTKSNWRDETRNKTIYIKSVEVEENVLNDFLQQHKHSKEYGDIIYYLYSDINSSNIKQEIINHLNSEGFIKCESKYRDETRNKTIYIKSVIPLKRFNKK